MWAWNLILKLPENFMLNMLDGLDLFYAVMQHQRSGIDGRTLARRTGCNKQGYSKSKLVHNRHVFLFSCICFLKKSACNAFTFS